MRRTLLVVDDKSAVRASLRLILEPRGYRILGVATGAEALALTATQAVDGALLDVNMPVMNGLELCRALRTQFAETGREFPIWMMTASCLSEYERAVREAGALALVEKPFDYDDLIRRFDECFGGPAAPAHPVGPK